MDEILYKALTKYYHALELKGYMSSSHSIKLLILSFYRDFVYNDYKGLISREDYRLIERVLDLIYGTSCLIPYPDYLKMGKLHLGELSELSERVQALEDAQVVKVFDAEGDSDIIVSEEDVDE